MSYSGIGASPIRYSGGSGGSELIRTGWASVKEDAFASLFWVRKWLILKETQLSFHKNEVGIYFFSLSFLPESLFSLTDIRTSVCGSTKCDQTG